MIEHKIEHCYQPTNHMCSQSALSMLLSFFGESLSAEEIAAIVPVNKNDKGEDWGTINQQLATWCLSRSYDVSLYTADFQVIDLSWAELSKDELLKRMEAAKSHRNVPSLGKEFSNIYMQSYIDFVKAGGKLFVTPYMTTGLIDELLLQSPLLACVSYNVLYNAGRSKDVGLRKSKPDDIDGKTVNHSIVIYGKDDKGSYLIADPWKEPGRHSVEPQRLLTSMTAAQVECDNLFFQLEQGQQK